MNNFNQLIKVKIVSINIFKKVLDYFRITILRFISDQCLQVAAALTFTSLLALVPLLAISVTIIKQVPAAQEFLAVGQEYLFQIFAPDFGNEVKSYLLTFVTKTQNLTTIGIVFIIITALLTLDTIEKTLNRIWDVKKSRKVLVRFSIYFIILTFGPVLIGISLSVSTYLSTTSFFSDTTLNGEVQYYYLALLPLFSTTLAFTILYKIVPNVKVPLFHALFGGIFAALLFEFAKRGFAYFITTVSTYQLIYGALAAIPLTLIWLYVSWLVILIGAEVTASSSDYLNLKNENKLHSGIDLCVAIKLLGDIGFLTEQEGISLDKIMDNELHIPDDLIIYVLKKLEQHELIKQQNNIWQLAREKSSYSIQELLSLSNPCCVEYSQQDRNKPVINKKIQNALAQIRTELKNSPPVLLKNIYD
ncbi:MAG: YihY family inner membrane protein [Thiohalomonadales bacterium]